MVSCQLALFDNNSAGCYLSWTVLGSHCEVSFVVMRHSITILIHTGQRLFTITVVTYLLRNVCHGRHCISFKRISYVYKGNLITLTASICYIGKEEVISHRAAYASSYCSDVIYVLPDDSLTS